MSQPHRIAFAGFRHPHIFALLSRAKSHPACEITAACETDPATREKLQAGSEVRVTHSSFEQMLAESDAEIVAIGDVYAQRGEMAISALRAGKHVLADKPLCTSLEELDEIVALAREKQLSVGCQLDLVEAEGVRQLRTTIQNGELGRLCTITISAQHPLRLDSRAEWYFQPGRHGGTINDIGIHVFDLVPWLSGQPWEKILLAREWNAKAIAFPHFKDCAQFYAIAEDELACFADVSYLAPDALGYDLPQYWRITVHGTRGMAEIRYGAPGIQVVCDQSTAFQEKARLNCRPAGYLQNLLDEIDGKPAANGLTTDRVLTASRWALQAQQIAKSNLLLT